MKNKIIYLVLLTFSFSSTYSQVKKESKGGKQYDKYAYSDVIKTYEHIYKKGYKSPNTLLKLGNAYYFNAELEKANKWYAELDSIAPEQEPEFYFRYAQTLKAVKNYEKANAMLEKFSEKDSEDLRAKNYMGNKDYMSDIQKNSGRYKIENAGINSPYSDYGPAFMGTKVVFSSARDTGGFTKRVHTWTGQSFTNLYSANMDADGNLSAVAKFGKKLNSKFHESTPTFTKDGKTVYFTRNNFLDGKGYNDNKVTLLKIYKATVDKDGKWGNITELPFCSDSFQTAHPALSPDGKMLYFASDMQGTHGESDIFRVKINDDGSFGTVENLGDKINTEGRESYPFVSDDNELYFASDGQLGLGGFDVFVTRIPAEGGEFNKVLNVGEEANSSKDDFGYIIDSKTKRGFFSSNRSGGQGNDDIYKFLETRPIFCDQVLNGLITDEDTKAILPNTPLVLLDENMSVLKSTVSGADGRYEFTEVECDTKYIVRASRENYTSKDVPVIIGKESGKTELNIELKSDDCRAKVGGNLADCFKINIIYFDLDKWNIRPDAAMDLGKLLDVLKKNPSMKIKIRSHTDSRASNEYNDVLSQKRAKSTKDWLVKNGIAKDRLESEGLGEKELINKCSNGVKCSEAEHQLNRRSEFIIIAL
ncbi:MAG: OmpA family protein [Flavobacterium sp.]